MEIICISRTSFLLIFLHMHFFVLSLPGKINALKSFEFSKAEKGLTARGEKQNEFRFQMASQNQNNRTVFFLYFQRPWVLLEKFIQPLGVSLFQ